MQRPKQIVAATLVLALVAPEARADVGLPMIALLLPPMWLALVPIVLIEAISLSRSLAIPFRRTLLPASIGNLASTIVGVPLAWVVLAMAEMFCCAEARGLRTFGDKLFAVTAQAPWLIPYSDDMSWMIPCALIVIAIPCYAVSVAIEAPVNRLLLRESTGSAIWKSTARANAFSYALLALLVWPAMRLSGHILDVFGPLMEWLLGLVLKAHG